MDNNISLGRKSKYGNVNSNAVHGGVKKEQLKTQAKSFSRSSRKDV